MRTSTPDHLVADSSPDAAISAAASKDKRVSAVSTALAVALAAALTACSGSAHVKGQGDIEKGANIEGDANSSADGADEEAVSDDAGADDDKKKEDKTDEKSGKNPAESDENSSDEAEVSTRNFSSLSFWQGNDELEIGPGGTIHVPVNMLPQMVIPPCGDGCELQITQNSGGMLQVVDRAALPSLVFDPASAGKKVRAGDSFQFAVSATQDGKSMPVSSGNSSETEFRFTISIGSAE